MITSGGAAMFAIVFMAAGVLLTVVFFAAAALIVVGHFKPSHGMQRAGWIVLAVWFLPSACWTYYLQTLTEHDQYRVLADPEVVYGVPLPAGAQVNYRRWARRVQWAVFRTPQTLQGVEYIDQVNFCGQRVCSATLARDQEIQGLPCRAQTVVNYSEIDGRLKECTLANPFVRQGVKWPNGTTVRIDAARGDSYLPPAGGDPIRVTGLLVHWGLIVWLTPEDRIRELDRNQSLPAADTRLEVGDTILQSDQYRFLPDGTIRGGILAQDAVIDGKPKKTGDPVVIPIPSPQPRVPSP
jgi:hypothetical protein